MTAPISRAYLPQTVTLFNVYKDPETGTVEYHRTILEAVRVDQARVSLREALRGAAKLRRISVLLDRCATQGYNLNETGRRVSKSYRPWRVWSVLPAEEKARAWTLNVGDLMAAAIGEKTTVCPEFEPAREQEFKLEHDLRAVIDIAPNIDKDGSVHSWEVGLD